MTLDEDLLAAVAAARQQIWSMLWDVAPSRRERVAEAAVRAAAPFLRGGVLPPTAARRDDDRHESR